MNFTIETEREDGGRWIAEVPELPGALAYGTTREEAIVKAEALDFACLPSAWNTAKPGLSLFQSPSPPHEFVAFSSKAR